MIYDKSDRLRKYTCILNLISVFPFSSSPVSSFLVNYCVCLLLTTTEKFDLIDWTELNRWFTIYWSACFDWIIVPHHDVHLAILLYVIALDLWLSDVQPVIRPVPLVKFIRIQRKLSKQLFVYVNHFTSALYWFDTLTVKQWEIMLNSDVLLFSAIKEETPYEQLLRHWEINAAVGTWTLPSQMYLSRHIFVKVQISCSRLIGSPMGFSGSWICLI